MKCGNALDALYEEDAIPLGKRLSLAFHVIFCRYCADHLEKYEIVRRELKTGFFPASPDYCDSIMDRIYEQAFDDSVQNCETGGFSIKSWAIAGVLLLVSLITIFFSQDFINIARDEGSSYLIPLGIIIGIVITGYGALFVGSHLKELSERFKL